MNSKTNLLADTKLKSQESFFVQVNNDLITNFQMNYEEITDKIGGSPTVVIDPMGTITLIKLSNKNIKNIKVAPNAIWAEIVENENIKNSLDYFSLVVDIITTFTKVESFTRVGIRKQYLYFFYNLQERRDFFKKIVNFEDFVDVGIVKNMIIKSIFSAKIQILPITQNEKFGIMLDIDIFLEDKNGNKEFNINNLEQSINSVHAQFCDLSQKIFG